MDIVKTVNLENGKKLEIFLTDADNPREWDNLCKMVCFHKNYNLGDPHDYNKDDFNSWEGLKDAIISKENPLVILPLYLYDHSGITINTTGFSCQWDSGQVGWAYITKKQLEYLGTTLNKGEVYSEFLERITKYLIDEVKTYDYYITGEVYGFSILNEHDESEDSCCGFFGDNWKENGLLDHINFELSENDLAQL